MRIVGVIAEYNPLHNGHIYHLEQARAQTGATYCIVVLSGNFVQRGEPACTDKFTRTEWALKAGADLVLELPTVYAVSSAERFALGGVRTLLSTGVVTDLAFGCEETDLETLYQLCDILVSEPPSFKEALRSHLQMGKSYARARYDALASYGVPQYMLSAVAKPNNLLAVEYLRAIRQYAPDIVPLPISRIGCGYNDAALTGEFSSATSIRKALQEGNREVLSAMPSFVGGPLLYDTQFPVTLHSVGDMILYAIRRMSAETLRETPEIGEGLENVMMKAARNCADIDAFFEQVKSKRYTMARCKRTAINALLGVTAAQVNASVRRPESAYLHVLGYNKAARGLLSLVGRACSAPLILRGSDYDACSDIALANLATDALSTDILRYATKSDIRRDYMAPIMI